MIFSCTPGNGQQFYVSPLKVIISAFGSWNVRSCLGLCGKHIGRSWWRLQGYIFQFHLIFQSALPGFRKKPPYTGIYLFIIQVPIKFSTSVHANISLSHGVHKPDNAPKTLFQKKWNSRISQCWMKRKPASNSSIYTFACALRTLLSCMTLEACNKPASKSSSDEQQGLTVALSGCSVCNFGD